RPGPVDDGRPLGERRRHRPEDPHRRGRGRHRRRLRRAGPGQRAPGHRADPGRWDDRARGGRRHHGPQAVPRRGVGRDARQAVAADRPHGAARAGHHLDHRAVPPQLDPGGVRRRVLAGARPLRIRQRPAVPRPAGVVLGPALLPAGAGADARGRRRPRRARPRLPPHAASVLADLRHRSADLRHRPGRRVHAGHADHAPQPGTADRRHPWRGRSDPPRARPGAGIGDHGSLRGPLHHLGGHLAVHRPADAPGGLRRGAHATGGTHPTV
ncbi:MAG: Integral membrane protein, partial [uncultured Nocardioides sp.]